VRKVRRAVGCTNLTLVKAALDGACYSFLSKLCVYLFTGFVYVYILIMYTTTIYLLLLLILYLFMYLLLTYLSRVTCKAVRLTEALQSIYSDHTRPANVNKYRTTAPLK
jgi:Ca2+/Na+ antiporter